MTSAPEPSAPLHPRITLLAACLTVLVVPLALSGTPVALPDIGRDLHAGVASLQWVVNAYNVTAASLMMAAGAVADRFGRRRVFALGVALYAASSTLAASSGNILLLNAARGISGVAAAAIMTAGVAAVAAMFRGAARTRAFAWIGVTIGAGLALGPTMSGVLTDSFGWRSVFLAHGLLAAISLAGFRFVTESRNPDAARLDIPGAITFTLALSAFILAIIQAPQLGWANPAVPGLFAASLALLVAFAAIERRQAQPMFDLSLFRQPRFMSVNLLATAISFGFVGPMVLLPPYLTATGGISTGQAGLTMLPLTAPVLIFPILSGRLVTAGVQARTVLPAGLLLVAAGNAWLTGIHPGIDTLGLLGPMVTIGTGIGLIYGLMDGAAVNTAPPAKAGAAAGMFNTIRLASQAIVVAGMIAALLALTQSKLGTELARYSPTGSEAASVADALTSGDMAAAASQAPASRQPDFTAFLADSYTDALRLVLSGAAALCLISAAVLHRTLTDATAPTPQRDDTRAQRPGRLSRHRHRIASATSTHRESRADQMRPPAESRHPGKSCEKQPPVTVSLNLPRPPSQLQLAGSSGTV